MWDFREAFLEWVLRWPRPEPKHPPRDPAPSLPPDANDFPDSENRGEHSGANT